MSLKYTNLKCLIDAWFKEYYQLYFWVVVHIQMCETSLNPSWTSEKRNHAPSNYEIFHDHTNLASF